MMTYGEMGDRVRAGERIYDADALDALADLLRLPAWNIGGSTSEFIDCVSTAVSAVRDTGGPPSADLLAAAAPVV